MAALPKNLPNVDAATELAPPRVEALLAWRQQNPSARDNEDALLEAASQAVIVETDAGPRFEPASFAELVDFIAELPF